VIYPSVVTFAVAGYALASQSGVSLPLSSFGAIVCGALLITCCERWRPFSMDWKPEIKQIKEDLTFMALIQIALPRLLALLVVFWLADQVGRDAVLAHLWPHAWPAFAQAILLVLCADLMRYGLHRLSHESPLLWRLHAVHHSPIRLYWLNTTRFHPIEKTLQFTLDSLPFLLMGVDPFVMGFWFVLYSVNGFFQHANIRLRFGVLSELFSTAEMHRWHHSQRLSESNSNYANVFILWDKLFGTFYRPRDRTVGTLGLLNQAYPTDFVSQMKAPFISGLDQANAPLESEDK
jgi:sterol desaturase/sphingolipid hydroxylase (fatty acid hydroxylase superfamily)